MIALTGSPLITKTLYWFHKVGYSIADQIVISGANFALNILLAKWTNATDYGAFSIAYSIFLLISGIHSALILEPMAVIAPTKYPSQVTEYRFVTLLMHFAFSFVLSICTFILAILFFDDGNLLLPHFYALCISISWIFLFYLLKRSCYLESKPDIAFKGSVVYATVLLVVLFALRKIDSLRSQDVFYVIAAANFFAATAIYNTVGVNFRQCIQSITCLKPAPIIKAHWDYGRWILAASVFHGLGNAIYLPAVGLIIGYAEAGILRAVQIFVQPLQQILFALSSLLVPWLSGEKRNRGSDFPLKMVNKIAFSFLAFGFGYFILFILFGQYLINFTYPDNQYTGTNTLLYLVGITGLITAWAQALGINLRAMGDANAILFSKLASLIFTVTLGIALVFFAQLYGAGLGMTLSISAEVIAMLLYIKIKYKKVSNKHEQFTS